MRRAGLGPELHGPRPPPAAAGGAAPATLAAAQAARSARLQAALSSRQQELQQQLPGMREVRALACCWCCCWCRPPAPAPRPPTSAPLLPLPQELRLPALLEAKRLALRGMQHGVRQVLLAERWCAEGVGGEEGPLLDWGRARLARPAELRLAAAAAAAGSAAARAGLQPPVRPAELYRPQPPQPLPRQYASEAHYLQVRGRGAARVRACACARVRVCARARVRACA